MSLTPAQLKILQEMRARYEKEKNIARQSSLFLDDDLPDFIHDRYGFLIPNPVKRRRF